MRVLLIGNGARENAIYNALKASYHKPEVVVFGKAKNPAMIQADFYEVGDIEDLAAIKTLAQKYTPDLAVVGPDNPIGKGAADVLTELKIPTFAPLKVLAQLESSKSFTRNLLQKYNIIGNPKFQTFAKNSTAEEIKSYIENELNKEYVVKYDGLFGGKGVKVSGEHLATVEDGIKFALECIQEGGKVVVEEKFIGPEFSFFCFADGKNLAPMPIVHDHKRAYNNDLGPNTGGMGTYSDANHLLPFVTEQDKAEALDITAKVQSALKQETGFDYCGIMYGGFIKTKNGVRLIEFNARFGDPEAMNLLPLLETDLIDILNACVNQTLDSLTIKFKEKASVCLYVVPSNYPDGPALADDQKQIKLNKEILKIPNLYTFFSSVDLVEETDTEYILNLSSSRALAFTGLSDTIEEARQLALQSMQFVSGSIAYRTDIGSKELIQKRIDLLSSFN